jgi:hypothetical protein
VIDELAIRLRFEALAPVLDEQGRRRFAAAEAAAAGRGGVSAVTNFRNGRREWRPQGSHEQVRVYDFVIPELGRAVPMASTNFAANTGWVSVGIDHDTAAKSSPTCRALSDYFGSGAFRPPGSRKVMKALDLGAIDFIPKSAQREVMLSAFNLIFSGGIYIPPEILDLRQANSMSAQTGPAS